MPTAMCFLTKNVCPFTPFQEILDSKVVRPITSATVLCFYTIIRVGITFSELIYENANGGLLMCAHFPVLTTILVSRCLYIVKSWFGPKRVLPFSYRFPEMITAPHFQTKRTCSSFPIFTKYCAKKVVSQSLYDNEIVFYTNIKVSIHFRS